ncbi:MAG: hypothetical protein HRU72_04880 [Planctomycetia bacterium]|jgi:hypothetical protein|nr:hypothetical protein [Candidatus Brocadia sapporoensis]MCC7238096.1 hypothetical protein [Candidatus Brocadia sp.]MEB2308360.1 hypothetical protein [Candidatus Brocadiaceae bacterium]QOJ05927.1 MAG: hypothetical protein HRU72_04880 [Planctomycetia bacterium]TWU52845.1 hypothetical protein B188_08060 [Candidatus Brocadiaceae bacterium B188]
MALGIFGPFNEIIYKTTTAIVDTKIAEDTAKILNAFITASFDAVNETLKKVQDITKPV